LSKKAESNHKYDQELLDFWAISFYSHFSGSFYPKHDSLNFIVQALFNELDWENLRDAPSTIQDAYSPLSYDFLACINTRRSGLAGTNV
jgi:hypothetical protein